MALTREEITSLLRENYPDLRAKYGIKRIDLFGSYAKETSSETSDVDLVIEFDHPVGFRFIELTEYLEHLLGKRVEVLTPAGIQDIRHPHIAEDIKRSIVYV